jgi:hypothetical protein
MVGNSPDGGDKEGVPLEDDEETDELRSGLVVDKRPAARANGPGPARDEVAAKGCEEAGGSGGGLDAIANHSAT